MKLSWQAPENGLSAEVSVTPCHCDGWGSGMDTLCRKTRSAQAAESCWRVCLLRPYRPELTGTMGEAECEPLISKSIQLLPVSNGHGNPVAWEETVGSFRQYARLACPLCSWGCCGTGEMGQKWEQLGHCLHFA